MYRPGKEHSNADALSRLPLTQNVQEEDADDEERVLWVNFLGTGPGEFFFWNHFGLSLWLDVGSGSPRP